MALPWMIQELTGSASALGLLAAAQQLPDTLLLPLAGSVADRYDRRQLMGWIDLFSGLLLLLLTLVVWRQFGGSGLSVAAIFLVAALLASGRSAYQPASLAFLPSTVPDAALTRANSFMTVAQGSSGIIGPSVAAYLVAVAGLSAAIAVDGLSFVISGLLIVSIRLPAGAVVQPVRRPVLSGIGESLTYIRQRPALLSAMLVFALLNMAAAPMMVLLPATAKNLGAGATGLALLSAALASGSMLGGVVAGMLPEVRAKGVFITVGLFAYSVTYLSFALSRDLPAALLIAGLWGALVPLIQVQVNVIFQRLVSPGIQGRVFSVRLFVARSVKPVALLFSGILADWLGVATVLVIGSCLAGVAAAAALASGDLRRLRL